MNKQEYLSAIRVRIPKMPTEDMERFIAYYSEMIDDRMEDGMTEEEAVAMMESGAFIFFIYRSPLDADTFTVSAFTS